MGTAELSGLFPDLVVPLNEAGDILIRDYIVHVQRMARIGEISGVVVDGRAGEHEGFDDAEREGLLEAVASAAPRGFPWVVGIHASAPDAASAEIETAARHGATAVILLGVPATEVAEVARSSAVGVIASLSASDELSAGSLASTDNVIGILTNTHDPRAFARLAGSVGDQTKLFAGSAGYSLVNHLATGADGAILAEANVAPEAWGRFVSGGLGGDWGRAMTAYSAVVVHLFDALGGGESDVTVAALKTALTQLTVFNTAELRVNADEEVDTDAMHTALVRAGLLLD
jgi:4-hydroxy-tetrahydrodipicolinate synthase